MTEQDVRRRFSADLDTDELAEVALAILSLTLHDNGRAWKGLDWDLMDLLEEKGWMVRNGAAELSSRSHFASRKADTMPFLFRTPVVIRRKQPYIDWANALDDTGPQLTAELAETRDIYLGRHSFSTPTLQQALDQMWDEIFEEELCSWSTDEQQWPKNRTRELFDAWFDAELCASIIDLVPDEPLTEGDIELEDLEGALNTCAVWKLVPRSLRKLEDDLARASS